MENLIYRDFYSEFEKDFENIGDWIDTYYQFCECHHCGQVGIEFEGRIERTGCCEKSKTYHKYYGFDTEKLMNAYEKSRMARF